MIKLKKGLDIPISGKPEQTISSAQSAKTVAVTGPDYLGMKPSMLVKEGDQVLKGQALFFDKKNPKVHYTAPKSGQVLAINRGAKRAFLTVTINVTGDEQIQIESYRDKDPAAYSAEEVKTLLIETGLWTAIRVRPFSKVASPDSAPHSIFITAMDTNPLAPDPAIIIREKAKAFAVGCVVLKKLTKGSVYLCKKDGTSLPGESESGVHAKAFSGPHPAGNVGTHIHYLDPIFGEKKIWHLGYQDVMSIGTAFLSGKLDTERVIALAGPGVKNPRLLRTTMGACLHEITQSELNDGDYQLISGSVLSGRAVNGPLCHLGRYHNQISVFPNDSHREFLGWLKPGLNRFSIKRAFLSSWLPSKQRAFSTANNGSLRAIVPIEAYEKVWPLEILPSPLLKALLAKDTDQAQLLGVMELDEEDLGLCTFVCPCKIDYGPLLRTNLGIIERDG